MNYELPEYRTTCQYKIDKHARSIFEEYLAFGNRDTTASYITGHSKIKGIGTKRH